MRVRKFLPQVLLVLLLALCGAGCQPAADRVHIGLAHDSMDRKEFELATEHFDEAIRANPKAVDAYLGRGECWQAQGDWTKAVTDYERALQLEPTNRTASWELAFALIEMGSGSQALPYFDMLDMANPEILLARGRAKLQNGETRQAKQDFIEVLKSDPKTVAAHYYRGLASAQLLENSEAEVDFTSVIKLEPTHAQAYWQRSLIRTRLQKKQLAEEDRKKAAELDPRLTFAESSVGKNMLETLTGRSGDDASLEPLTKANR